MENNMIKDIINRIKDWPALTRGYFNIIVFDDLNICNIWELPYFLYKSKIRARHVLFLYSGSILSWFTDMFMPSMLAGILHDIHNNIFLKSRKHVE